MKLFRKVDLYNIISFAKKERVDKQYYVDFELTEKSATDLLVKAENFLVKMKLVIRGLRLGQINEIRGKLKLVMEN